MDLSSYISFLVKADIRDVAAPVFALTDNSVYPDGVVPTGIFTITQPDGITRTGVFTAPDISGGNLRVSIDLRLTSELKLQQGEYTIKYQVDADGYLPTTLSRSFIVSYKRPDLKLMEIFDLFTPALEYEDQTVYNAGSFTQTITRAWGAVIGTVGSITGTNSASFDLKYGASYYDAAYTINFSASVVYQSTTYSFLSIEDLFTKQVVTDAYTPPTSDQLLTYLTSLKTKLDALINNCEKYDKAKADYEYAYTLYSHAMKRICANDKVGVASYIEEIVGILSITPSHTNTAISVYVYDCGGGGSIEAPVPFVLEVIAGTAEAIAAGIIVGETTFTNDLIANKYIQVLRGGIWVPSKDPLNGGMFYTKTYVSNTTTFSTPIQDTEVISINTI